MTKRITTLLSKTKTYFILQGVFLCCILLAQLFWVFSKSTNGQIIEFSRAASQGKWKHIELMTVRYWVAYHEYTETYTRNETPLAQKTISIRYSIFFPSVSRLNTFEGNWEEYLIWYLIFFGATTMIFFVPNTVLPKGTMFEFCKRYPFVKLRYGTAESRDFK
jgi:hypothetical protein